MPPAEIRAIPAGRVDSSPLGLVGDVLAGADGRLYVMDFGEKRLTVIPRGAGTRQVLGRMGRGPGEFVDPVALAAAGAGGIYLLDRGTQRLELYRLGPGGASHGGSLALDFTAEDVCTLDGRVFLLGPRSGYLVHEISQGNGRVLRSLVPEPASHDPMLSAYHGAGFLACGPGDELTMLPLLRPEISRYSASTGRRLGRVRIPGYRETRVARAGGSVTYQAPPGGISDYGASLVRRPDGRMLVQVGPVQRGASRYEFTALRTLLLSWSEESLAELPAALPRIASFRGDTAVAVHTEPAPSLSLVLLPP